MNKIIKKFNSCSLLTKDCVLSKTINNYIYCIWIYPLNPLYIYQALCFITKLYEHSFTLICVLRIAFYPLIPFYKVLQNYVNLSVEYISLSNITFIHLAPYQFRAIIDFKLVESIESIAKLGGTP